LEFAKLAEKAEISDKIFHDIMTLMLSKSDLVKKNGSCFLSKG
jgi:hypothetical protein